MLCLMIVLHTLSRSGTIDRHLSASPVQCHTIPSELKNSSVFGKMSLIVYYWILAFGVRRWLLRCISPKESHIASVQTASLSRD
jgi:hypothetical protein